MQLKTRFIAWLIGLFLSLHSLSLLRAQGTAFTYQGRLNSGGNPANGSYVFRFTLLDGPNGNNVGAPVTTSPVQVSNGSFTVKLDFGPAAFTGAARWLSIELHPDDNLSDFTLLAPPQPLLPTPYAMFAAAAGSAATATNALTAVMATAATNFISSLAGDVTGPQGATVVASVGGQTAADVASGVTAANLATSANVPGTLAKRDGAGNFAAGTLSLDGALNLPAVGPAINAGSTTILRSDPGYNFFTGPSAGNPTLSGSANTGHGGAALANTTSGTANTALGFSALYFNADGDNNTAVGFAALDHNTSASRNTASGYEALFANTTGADNTAAGAAALQANTVGLGNTAIGAGAMCNNTSGSGNIAIGNQAGASLTTGSYNIAVGNPGVAGENSTIHIGTQGNHTNTTIAGIFGHGIPDGLPVGVNASGKLGTLSGQLESRIAITNTGALTISLPGSYYLTTNITVSSGNAIVITANNVTLDLNGYTISSTAPVPQGTGILLDAVTGTWNVGVNITILNGFIQGGVTNNSSGVFSGTGFRNGIASTHVDANGFLDSANIRVVGVSIAGCLDDGIYLGTGSLVDSCMVFSVGHYGIRAYQVINCKAVYCGTTGIQCLQAVNSYGSGYLGGIESNSAQGCMGQGNVGVSAQSALNCYGIGGSVGVQSRVAQNCIGGGATGVDATIAQNSSGSGGDTGTGISASVAIGCVGDGAFAIEADIGNSCFSSGGLLAITHEYNMP